MSRRLRLLIVLLLLSNHSVAEAAAPKTLVMDPERTVVVSGPISGNVIEKANDLVELAQANKKDIYLLINSPGGMVLTGELFIDAMQMVQAQGIKIKCVTTVIAASMAYSIYAHCDERYATPSALLLYHPARISGQVDLKGPDAKDLAEELNELDEELLDFLERVMGMDRERLEQTFRAEKLWKASKLAAECRKGFINIVTVITGSTTLYKTE